MSTKDDDALLDVIRLHIGHAPARQMLAEIARTRVAMADENFRRVILRLLAALDARPNPPNPYKK